MNHLGNNNMERRRIVIIPSHLIKLSFIFMFIASLLSCSEPTEEDYAPYLEFQSEWNDDALTSSGFPKGKVSFSNDIQYIGSDSFILYKVASCQIHLFAAIDSAGGLERLYWIQYEGYLPRKLLPSPYNLKPGGLKYDYSEDPQREKIAGKDFYVKPGNFTIDFSDEELQGQNSPDDSDFLHVGRLLFQNGLNLNSEVLSVRMVHLSPDKSKELMIIYYELLDDNDERVAALEDKGIESVNWPEVSRELIDRAIEGINLEFQE